MYMKMTVIINKKRLKVISCLCIVTIVNLNKMVERCLDFFTVLCTYLLTVSPFNIFLLIESHALMVDFSPPPQNQAYLNGL